MAIGSDNLISRLGIRALLEQAEGVQVVADTDVLGACAYAQLYPVDAILLDGSFSLETAQAAAGIVAKLERTAVLFLGPSPASAWLAGRVNSGRALILHPATSLQGMVAAIYGALEKPVAFAPGNASDLTAKSRGQPFDGSGDLKDRLGALLSAREWEVLVLVAKGYTDKEIAGGLVLSTHTVKGHVRNLLRKLRVPNRTAAAATFFALVPAPAVDFTRP